ncbi:SH3GL interacting endocytic adaptor 1 [Phyllostomus discolor]|uniref:SH3GL interacting endocytic adaptor 1 n=1 Tax=Phyllostomus discolor TaxID=89673 RepID=A0A834AAW9_9CHIR|nr:SH3GL interacting endocytic adaptor 1 [Phyllostomus discolor]
MYCEDYWRNGVVLPCRHHQTLCQQPIASCPDFSGDKFQQVRTRPAKSPTSLLVSAQGIQSTPLNLAVNWRCEPASTDLRIDYKYNTDAMTTAVALNNVQFLVPIDGGVTKLQAVLPPAVWNAEQQRILWKIPDISLKSENGGVGSLLARFQLSEGPSKPSPLVVQFTSEGSTLSGCDIELVGAGYRFSLIKKRFAAGKYLADN